MSSPFIIIDEIEEKLTELNNNISNTLSTINSNINTINTNVNTVSRDFGTANTNINAIKTATAANTTASATGTLSSKLSWIGNSLIGATNNTGGTATTGTVFAKLNILMKLIFKKDYIITTTVSTSLNSKTFNLSLSNILVVYSNLYTSSGQTSSGSTSRGYSYVYITANDGSRKSYGGSTGSIGTKYLFSTGDYDEYDSTSGYDQANLVTNNNPLYFSSLKAEGTFYDGYSDASSSVTIKYIQL